MRRKLWWVEGLALASDQIMVTQWAGPGLGSRIDTDGGTVYHGLLFNLVFTLP